MKIRTLAAAVPLVAASILGQAGLSGAVTAQPPDVFGGGHVIYGKTYVEHVGGKTVSAIFYRTQLVGQVVPAGPRASTMSPSFYYRCGQLGCPPPGGGPLPQWAYAAAGLEPVSPVSISIQHSLYSCVVGASFAGIVTYVSGGTSALIDAAGDEILISCASSAWSAFWTWQ